MLKKIFICIFICVLTLQMSVLGNSNTFQSSNIICIERNTGRVLFNKGGFEKKKIASLTKLLTAVVVCENVDLNDTFVVSRKASQIGGSTVGIKAGENVKVRNLLYGLLLSSGNDCAICLAEGVAGSVENFSIKMNKKAREIGAKNSNFITPHGLDNENHYSTCMDMAKIMNYAMKNKEIAKIISTKNIDVNFGSFNKSLKNTNRLLHKYPYITGGKTGFTNGAQRCLAVSAKKDDLEVICIVLGSETTDIRFNEAKTVIDYCLENYRLVDISKQMKWYINIDVEKGNIAKYEDYIKGNLIYPLKQEEVEKIRVSQEFIPIIKAPLNKGSVIGEIELYIEDELIYTNKVKLKENIYKNNIKDYLNKGLKDMFQLNFHY